MNIAGMGTDIMVGGVLGVGSQLAEQYDAKKISEADQTKKFSELKKIGNYVAFVPFGLGLLGSVTDFIPLDKKWTDKLLLAGSVLAGQKIASIMSRKHYKLVYSSAGYANAQGQVLPRGGTRTFSPAPWRTAERSASAYGVLDSTDVMV